MISIDMTIAETEDLLAGFWRHSADIRSTFKEDTEYQQLEKNENSSLQW